MTLSKLNGVTWASIAKRNGVVIASISKVAGQTVPAGSSDVQNTVTIDNTGNASTLTNYQVKIAVTYAATMQADFSDLRFRDTDNTTALSFWIESYVASTSAVVWVKVPSIAGSSTKTIYMHHGDTAAAGRSSGYDTFLLFDDNYFSYPVIKKGTAGAWDSARVVGGGIGLDTLTGTYHMYYLGETADTATFKMGHATSTDLFTWTKDAGNPILSPADAWEGAGYNGGVPLTDLQGNLITYSGKYWIAYACVGTPQKNGLASADSPNGPWTKHGSNPIFSGRNDGTSWDSYGVVIFSLVKEGSTFYIFYEATSSSSSEYSIGYATSTDLLTWTRSASAILTSGGGWEASSVLDPIIRKYGSTYYLFYTGGPKTTSTSQANGYATATSITGTYTKFGSNPITPQGVSFPQVIQRGNTYFIIGDNHNLFDKTMYATNDLTKLWEWKAPTGAPVVSSAQLTLKGSTVDSVESPKTFQYKAARGRINWKGSNTKFKWWGFITGNGASDYIVLETPRTGTNLILATNNGSASTSTVEASVSNAFKIYDIMWKSGEVIVKVDGSGTVTKTTNIPSSSINHAMKNFEDTTSDLVVDWTLIREYSKPEPTTSVS